MDYGFIKKKTKNYQLSVIWDNNHFISTEIPWVTNYVKTQLLKPLQIR